MKLERTEPAAGLSAISQLRLPGFERIMRNIPKQVQIALGIPAPLLPLADRVAPIAQFAPRLIGLLAGLCQAYIWPTSKPHFATLAIYCDPQEPFAVFWSDLASQSPASSQCLPAFRDMTPRALNVFLAIYASFSVHLLVHP